MNFGNLFITTWLLAGVLYASTAHAMPTAEDATAGPIAVWFSQQYSPQGDWCCNKADGHYYDGDYNLNADGSVTLAGGRRIEAGRVLTGEVTHWPDGSVTGGPNPTGHAVIWYSGETLADSFVYCFSPGALT